MKGYFQNVLTQKGYLVCIEAIDNRQDAELVDYWVGVMSDSVRLFKV
jgi:hypothetical protein